MTIAYQHQHKAGNAADVFKHCFYIQLIQHLQQSETSLQIIETHAGNGLYPLDRLATDHPSQKGIHRLWQVYKKAQKSQKPSENLPGLALDYLAKQAEYNPKHLTNYLASPYLIWSMLRENDVYHGCEKEVNSFNQLTDNFKNSPFQNNKGELHQTDGFNQATKLLLSNMRSLVLLDPPYESPQEYQLAVDAILNITAYTEQASICLWYPLINQVDLSAYWQQLKAHGVDFKRIELITRKALNQKMYGSGLLLINLDEIWDEREMQKLAQLLAEDNNARFISYSV